MEVRVTAILVLSILPVLQLSEVPTKTPLGMLPRTILIPEQRAEVILLNCRSDNQQSAHKTISLTYKILQTIQGLELIHLQLKQWLDLNKFNQARIHLKSENQTRGGKAIWEIRIKFFIRDKTNNFSKIWIRYKKIISSGQAEITIEKMRRLKILKTKHILEIQRWEMEAWLDRIRCRHPQSKTIQM